VTSVSDTFGSILFPGEEADRPPEPAWIEGPFRDLGLDQIVDAATSRWSSYDLAPFFRVPLRDPDAILYRQEVMRDLERDASREAVAGFCRAMRKVDERRESAEEIRNEHASHGAFLEAVVAYLDAVESLEDDLSRLRSASRGLVALGAYLRAYVGTCEYRTLAESARKLRSEFSTVRYAVTLRGDRVTVGPPTEEGDFSARIAETFERFRPGRASSFRIERSDAPGLNHVTGQILDRVARLNPRPFGALATLRREHASFMDEVVARFAREAPFYLAWLGHIAGFRRADLPFCYPCLSTTSKRIDCRDTFDLALAGRLRDRGVAMVRNDFRLEGAERMLIVTGPNQGGKSTLARTFGQLHYLARLGCPVPGRRAELYVCDRLFTHFERREDLGNLRGRLKDALVRFREILESATPDSLIILNEPLASTALEDAVRLAGRLMRRLRVADIAGVWVTFLTELATFDESTVSMVAQVDPDDPAIRTFRVERSKAEGTAHARALARKHRITYEQLRERLSP